jgi:hypothetical protein
MANSPFSESIFGVSMSAPSAAKTINWRERFIAAGIHFLITALIAGLAAALIFLVWFPGALAEMAGGTKLFGLVVGIDMMLGPLISLVIYNSAKPRRELIVDYSVVGLVQLAALVYGVWVVAASRPVAVAFDVDRFEIVTAIELDDADLAAAAPEYRSKSWVGPRLVYVYRSPDPKEQKDMMDLFMSGKEGHVLPKYYRPYEMGRELAKAKSGTLAALLAGSGSTRSVIEKAIAKTGKPMQELRWLLLHSRFGFGFALIDAESAMPLQYVAIDPVWLEDKSKR